MLADRTRLRQVLLNILGNAVKFTDQGGVWLSARADEHTGRVTVLVRDSGIGIDDGDQRGLFEEFRQVDSSYRRRQGGLGLGLAISKVLMERMGGSIDLRSAGLGKGTTVTMSIGNASRGV